MPERYRTIVADPPWTYEQFVPPHTPSQKRAWRIGLPYRMSPGPYVELFARRAGFGWDYWGDQSLGTAELPEVA
jgi:hypothetical protein